MYTIGPALGRLKQEDLEFQASLGLHSETLSEKEEEGEVRRKGREGNGPSFFYRQTRSAHAPGPAVPYHMSLYTPLPP